MTGSNPFSSRFIRPDQVEYIFPEGESCHQLVKQLEVFGWRGQILGPHGTGKTTLIWNLVRALPESLPVKFLQMQSHQKKIREAKCLFESDAYSDATHDLLIVDGLEALSWLERRQMLLRPKLLVSTHRDFGLPMIYRTQGRPDLFKQLVQRLIDGFKGVEMEDIDAVLARHQGNCREALFELYDQFEQDDTNRSPT